MEEIRSRRRTGPSRRRRTATRRAKSGSIAIPGLLVRKSVTWYWTTQTNADRASRAATGTGCREARCREKLSGASPPRGVYTQVGRRTADARGAAPSPFPTSSHYRRSHSTRRLGYPGPRNGLRAHALIFRGNAPPSASTTYSPAWAAGGWATCSWRSHRGRGRLELVVIKQLRERPRVDAGSALDVPRRGPPRDAASATPTSSRPTRSSRRGSHFTSRWSTSRGSRSSSAIRGPKRALMPLRPQLRIFSRQTLGALHYAHELADYDGTPLRIVHRDVSPQNVIVTYERKVKLVDFGIAKAADATTAPRPASSRGRSGTSAPEQIVGKDIDRRVGRLRAPGRCSGRSRRANKCEGHAGHQDPASSRGEKPRGPAA